MHINWYPGHMAKTRRLIRENLSLIDVVFEVIDARIPKASKIKDIDDLISGKPRLLIMSKADLCDELETKKWISYYEKLGYTVLLVSLMEANATNIIISKAKEMLEFINEKRVKQGLKERTFRALIVGVPNVGKSTLINRLVGKKATEVGDKPGVTKSLSWIRINKDFELMDSPGILWPKLEDQALALNLATFAAIKEEILPVDKIAEYILDTLANYYPQLLLQRFKLTKEEVEDKVNAFAKIGKNRGCLIKGGLIDEEKVISVILKDLRDGYIGRVTFDRYE